MLKITQRKRWCLASSVLLLLIANPGKSEIEPDVQRVYDKLIQAVQQDNNVAYRAARSSALELDEQQFDDLLDMLEKAGTWQALALQGGLRVRRENPKLAIAFDESLEWLKSNPSLMRDGTYRFRCEYFNERFATSEGDWLRFEVVLTEKAELPSDRSGGMQLPGWIEFRRSVFRSGTSNRGNMRIWIKLYQDKPEWISWREAIRWFPHVARRSAGLVDEYVPELLEMYMHIHKKILVESYEDQLNPEFLFFERLARTRAYIELMQAIAEAESQVALPALNRIREFHQTTGKEIQSSAGLMRTRLQNVEELHAQALREGREDDARKLASERRDLQARDVVPLGASQLGRIRETLGELIEKHEKAVDGR